MSLSRIELDGAGSPRALAQRIHELDPDLAPDFDIEAVCRSLDIEDIKRIDTSAFAAALVMDANKAAGSILVADGGSPRRQRFSIGHELGHFLIPSHVPAAGQQFACSHEDLKLVDSAQQDRHRRIEAEANRFAAELLMPAARVRAGFSSLNPDLADIVRLAREFQVSKEAMARRYLEVHRADLAIVIVHHNRIERIYRPDDFPWIDVSRGQTISTQSIAHSHGLAPGTVTELEECDAETWLGDRAGGRVEILCEQVLAQRDNYATILLQVEFADGP